MTVTVFACVSVYVRVRAAVVPDGKEQRTTSQEKLVFQKSERREELKTEKEKKNRCRIAYCAVYCTDSCAVGVGLCEFLVCVCVVFVAHAPCLCLRTLIWTGFCFVFFSRFCILTSFSNGVASTTQKHKRREIGRDKNVARGVQNTSVIRIAIWQGQECNFTI